MRTAILLLLAVSFGVAAPVPKAPAKSDVELKLSAQTTSVLEITIHNHGKVALELPYRVLPLELISVTLRGEKGKSYTTPNFAENAMVVEPGTLTIPAGKSETLSLHTCHFLSEAGEPGEKITFSANLKLGKIIVVAQPLTVGD